MNFLSAARRLVNQNRTSSTELVLHSGVTLDATFDEALDIHFSEEAVVFKTLDLTYPMYVMMSDILGVTEVQGLSDNRFFTEVHG